MRAQDGNNYVFCRVCAYPVEPERFGFAIPICYACLPPPKPLPKAASVLPSSADELANLLIKSLFEMQDAENQNEQKK